jgi:flagellar protein FlaG
LPEQEDDMTTETQTIGTPSFAPALNTRVQTPGQNAAVEVFLRKPQVKLPPKAEVVAPKAVDIQYDPNEMRQSLQSAIKLLNDQVSTKAQGLGFSYDNSVKNPVITVRNTQTGQVVRQIPSEDVLRMAHNIDQLKGILFNAKA